MCAAGDIHNELAHAQKTGYLSTRTFRGTNALELPAPLSVYK